MTKLFIGANIISFLIYLSVFFIPLNPSPPRSEILKFLMLLVLALFFLSLRSIGITLSVFKRASEMFKKGFAFVLSIFVLIFPLFALYVAWYYADRKQVIPYLLFQIYYVYRFHWFIRSI